MEKFYVSNWRKKTPKSIGSEVWRALMSLSNIICSIGASTCFSRETNQIAPGYYCRRGICHTCRSGFYSVDGGECENCPTGTTSIDSSSSCNSLLNFTRPGVEKVLIPYGTNKIRVYLKPGDDCRSDASRSGESDLLSSDCGVVSSCLISAPMNSTLYVIVGSSNHQNSAASSSSFEGNFSSSS